MIVIQRGSGGGADATAASQAEMEAATDTSKMVTPGRTQYHPGVAKAWIRFDGTGTPAAAASYNVSSITDNAVGDWTINFTTSFSSGNYGFALGSRSGDGSVNRCVVCVHSSTAPTASAFRLEMRATGGGSGTVVDVATVGATFFGDQ